MVRWDGSVGILRVRLKAGAQSRFYLVQAIPCDGPGEAFGVLRLTDPVPHHVRVADDRRHCSCDCKGFLHYQRCRHVLALRALWKAGKLAYPVPS